MPLEVKDIFEATSKNVREMLSERGLGLYIPPYQRPYGWDREKVHKLVEDVLHGYSQLIDDSDSFTFLGTVITIHDINNKTVQPIVRAEVPSRVLTVIDGQQRLTTLLTFCMVLHNRIRLVHSAMLKGRNPDKLSQAEVWLHAQALRTIEELSATFFERHPYGDAPPYPRMIRAFSDQWARSAQNAKYVSPIACLISSYVATLPGLAADLKPAVFKPKERDGHIEGEAALVDCFQEMVKLLNRVAQDERDEEDEDVPSLAKICSKDHFQLALLGHEMPKEVLELLLSDGASKNHKGLIRLILVSLYFLTRVAVTMVRGKNEHYAFTVFESLNTTGEPLTAFETFKPRVVAAEKIENYEASASRKDMDEVSRYLSGFKVGDPLQNATRDLLIYFASAETGAKLSKRLADQRRYLKDEFDRYEDDAADRTAFVANLKDVARFIESSGWNDKDKVPALAGLPADATTDTVKMCLAFLRALGHSVTIAPLSRFYAKAVAANEQDKKKAVSDFECAVKAMAAFSVIWRASHRGTQNIDSEYRELMIGLEVDDGGPWAPLARSRRRGDDDGLKPVVDIDLLKEQLRQRLSSGNHGGVAGRASFIELGSRVPAFTNNRVVSRFVLLAAYHDAVEDPVNPGMIVKGKSAVSPCLSYSGFTDDRHLTLEHIAPQKETVGWERDIWAEPETPHSIGNLVLTPLAANASLSNRPWTEKRVLYSALSSQSEPEAEKVLADCGIDFGESTHEVAKSAAFMPHLAAVSKVTTDWSAEIIRRRSECLLGLAWDQLYPWLQ